MKQIFLEFSLLDHQATNFISFIFFPANRFMLYDTKQMNLDAFPFAIYLSLFLFVSPPLWHTLTHIRPNISLFFLLFNCYERWKHNICVLGWIKMVQVFWISKNVYVFLASMQMYFTISL